MGAVTNFLSVVEARSLGTADIDKMAAAIDKQSAALENLGKKADKVGENKSLSGFADKIKQGLTDPLGAMESAAIKAFESMGPLGSVTAGVGVVLGSMAVAGFSAAKSLAEYGQQIENAGLRTGLTTKEIAQFGFAAKLVDQDLSVFERTMRGLTAAFTDNSAAGAKARDALKEIGVVPRQLNGELKPTGQLLLEISAALGAIPNALDRNKVGMEIFKKAWIEIAPAILKLTEGVKIANQQGFFGPNQQQLDRWDEYDKKVTIAEAKFDKLIRQGKEWLALNLVPDDEVDRLKGVAENAARRGLPTLAAPGAPQSSIAAALFGADASRVSQDQAAGNALLNGARTRIDATLEGLRSKAEQAKQKYDEAYNSIRTLSDVGAAAAQKEIDTVSSLKKTYEGLNEQLKLAEKTESARLALLEKAQSLRQSGTGFLQFGAGVGGFIVTNDQISSANRRNRPPSLFGAGEANPFASQGFGSPDLPEGLSANGAEFITRASARGPQIGGESVEQLNARSAAITGKRNSDEQMYLGMLRSEADFTAQLIELRAGPNGELAAAVAVAGIREAALKDELKTTGDINAYREASRRNEIEFELKIAQLERKRYEDRRNTGEQLFDAALGGKAGIEQFVKNFFLGQARTLAGNVFAEAFRNTSVNFGLGGKVFQGTIFGQDPLKGATDMNTLATSENTQAIMAFNARLAASSSGGGGGTVSGLRGFGRFLPGSGVAYDPFAPGENGDYNGGAYDPFAAGQNGDWDGSGVSTAPQSAFRPSAAQYGTAAVGTGLGIYGAITSPSTKGKLASGGGALMSAGQAVPPPVGPAMMIAGAAMQFASMILGDPKVQRGKERDEELAAARYAAPLATTYTMDRYGHGFDMDTRGGLRIEVNIPMQAIDTQDFKARLPQVIDMVSEAIENKMSPRLETNIRRTAFPR